VPNSAWSSSVSVSSRAVASGKNVTFTSIFQNPTSAVVIVNFEVYDSHGTRVYQSASSNIFVAAGEHKISRPWTVPYGTVAGQYTVAFGVFSRDWKDVLLWVNPASTFDVAN